MSENPVLFGIKDAPVKCTYTDNVLYGPVEWLVKPKPEQERCPVCQGTLACLIQIVAPHPAQPDGAVRKLFILVCPWDKCSDRANGWRVIRQVKHEEIKLKPKTVTTTNWGGDDEDEEWGADDEWGLSETVEKMTIGEKTRVETVVTSLGTGHYINVVEDYQSADDDLSHENELLRKYEENEGKMDESEVGSGGGVKFGDEDDEDDERPEEKLVSEFLACCRRQPEQLLRYQLHGRPLQLDYQYAQGHLVPPCPACGGQRAFELQLMPYLAHLTKLSFGTVQVFTCMTNCRESNSTDEFALLQLEPDAAKFR